MANGDISDAGPQPKDTGNAPVGTLISHAVVGFDGSAASYDTSTQTASLAYPPPPAALRPADRDHRSLKQFDSAQFFDRVRFAATRR